MLYSIFGPTSSGKSTLIRALQQQENYCIGVQYARRLAQLKNYRIDDISKDPQTCMLFHLELLELKKKIEEFAIASSEIWFTERSFIDFFVFLSYYFQTKFKVYLKRDLEAQQLKPDIEPYYGLLYEFYKQCVYLDRTFYTTRFYLTEIPNKENDNFRLIHDDFIKEQKLFYNFHLINEPDIIKIETESVNERQQEIIQAIKKV